MSGHAENPLRLLYVARRRSVPRWLDITQRQNTHQVIIIGFQNVRTLRRISLLSMRPSGVDEAKAILAVFYRPIASFKLFR